MTATQNTTPFFWSEVTPAEVHTLVSHYRAEYAARLAANVAEAQAAGDLAYALALRAGMGGEYAADAYHAVFTDSMAAAGTPMPCSCDYCSGRDAGDR